MSHDSEIRARVPKRIKDRLQSLADAKGQSLSAMMRLLICNAAEAEEAKEAKQVEEVSA